MTPFENAPLLDDKAAAVMVGFTGYGSTITMTGPDGVETAATLEAIETPAGEPRGQRITIPGDDATAAAVRVQKMLDDAYGAGIALATPDQAAKTVKVTFVNKGLPAVIVGGEKASASMAEVGQTLKRAFFSEQVKKKFASPRRREPGFTIRNGKKPPGRNEPCRCGSGKKFKKCCGGAVAASAVGKIFGEQTKPAQTAGNSVTS